MSYCTPCPPCDTNFPLLCEPLETTANGKRLVVEDSAACQKTIQTPVAQQVLKTDGAGNLTWTNGASGTVLRKDSTGLVEFATINSVLQAGPIDLGSQPLTTTGAITTGAATIGGSITATSGVFSVSSSTDAVRITQTGSGNSLTVEDSTNPDSSPFVVDSNGSVGIGTATPTTKLHIESTGFGAGRALFKSSDAGNYITIQGTNAAGTNDTAFIDFQDGDVANSAFIGLSGQATVQSGDLRFYTGGNVGNVRLIIKKQGNIGIGTATPAKTLHVNGTVRLQGLPIYANNAAAISGGLVADDVYKTSTGELRIVV
jgi:hypothetical protein